MKTSTKKTLLVSLLAMACAGGAYAQGAGGAGGAGGGTAGAAAGTGTGTGGGTRGGTGMTPNGNTLSQPGTPGARSNHSTSGYGTPGSIGSSSGRYHKSRSMNRSPSDTTGGYSPQQEGQTSNSTKH